MQAEYCQGNKLKMMKICSCLECMHCVKESVSSMCLVPPFYLRCTKHHIYLGSEASDSYCSDIERRSGNIIEVLKNAEYQKIH
jgi:hypothetical protein